MGLIDALKAGNYQYVNNSNANINIKTGNGNNNINVNGGNINIETGNGNQNINAITANNLNIQTGTVGKDTINACAFKGIINTNESDDIIKFTGTNFDISALDGNKTVIVNGNTNDNQYKNSIKLGDGALNQIRSTANNVDIKSGNGALQLGFIGNNVGLEAGEGEHAIGFWGNNVNLNLGNGNNYIQTLDVALANGNFNDFGADKVLEKQTTISTKNIGQAEITGSTFDVKDAIAKKYNLSPTEIKTLNSINLDDKFDDGSPLYAIAKSVVNHPGEYVVVRRDGPTHSWGVTEHECIASNAAGWKTDTIAGTTTSQSNQKVETTYLLNGVSNVNINAKNGNNNINLTLDVIPSSNNNIELGVGDNNIKTRNGFSTSSIDVVTSKTQESKSANVLVNAGATVTSPLVIDFDKDGKVEATAAMGVDIDNNGIADGAATGGDKMLAMSNFNGNGKIDGQEVFGDQTVSPFTGEKINAANGFEALKVIAEQAKQYTGIDCMKNGSVDLQALKTALSTKGVNLGFISDNNTSNLEDLGHVASINVANYTEQDATGDVQDRQLGSYTDTDGSTQKVDDVWFTAQTAENKPNFLELLKKIK